MVTRDVLKAFKIALAYGSFNFDNFQNITRAHKSRNALEFKRIPYTYYSTNFNTVQIWSYCYGYLSSERNGHYSSIYVVL